MRWSQAFIPTLRDDPADAEAVSHKLLVRGGFIRQLMSGVYSIAPLGMRVRAKIARVIREEHDAIGGQEFLLPAIHPGELWQKSGRWYSVGEEMFRLKDRRGTDICLGMTHEEVFATLAAELNSYRELPQIWYQIQTKFRDEPRPKSGLLRTREFTMKDAYTFDVDDAGLDDSFARVRDAYVRIFERLGLDALPVEASSGVMGGTESVEFMVAGESGEDQVVRCPNRDYAANMERAVARNVVIADPEPPERPERFPTPGVRTIAGLAEFDAGAPADRQIKTLVYVLEDQLTLVLLRGDHTLVEQKLQDATGAISLRPAHPSEVSEALGALPGSLGAVGVAGLPIIADNALRDRTSMVTGANDDDVHLRGVDVARDIQVGAWHDLREIAAGEACVECGAPLEVLRAMEVGHIFKLGRTYAEAIGATVLGEDGAQRTIVMGSYGIGLERNMAAVVENHHDDKGIVWPVPLAPYECVVTVLRPGDGETLAVGERIYEELTSAGIEAILDDRDERPGVKFNDADLVGFPHRINVGPRGLQSGVVEWHRRAEGATEELPLDDVAGAVIGAIEAART